MKLLEASEHRLGMRTNYQRAPVGLLCHSQTLFAQVAALGGICVQTRTEIINFLIGVPGFHAWLLKDDCLGHKLLSNGFAPPIDTI